VSKSAAAYRHDAANHAAANHAAANHAAANQAAANHDEPFDDGLRAPWRVLLSAGIPRSDQQGGFHGL